MCISTSPRSIFRSCCQSDTSGDSRSSSTSYAIISLFIYSICASSPTRPWPPSPSPASSSSYSLCTRHPILPTLNWYVAAGLSIYQCRCQLFGWRNEKGVRKCRWLLSRSIDPHLRCTRRNKTKELDPAPLCDQRMPIPRPLVYLTVIDRRRRLPLLLPSIGQRRYVETNRIERRRKCQRIVHIRS